MKSFRAKKKRYYAATKGKKPHAHLKEKKKTTYQKKGKGKPRKS
jgi:hypothetical protein